MRTWSGRKPGSTARIFWKLRRNAPEAVNSTNATAISETTRAERSQEWLEAPVPVPAPSFSPCDGLVRRAAKAGARLQRMPVATASRRAKVTTFASIEIELTRGMESGRRCKAVRIIVAARARPSRPPGRLSRRLSKIDSRIMVLEPAPRARRRAYSRRRRMARTSSRPATLTQASRSTTETAINRVRSTGRTSPTASSRSGVTSPRMWMADMVAGKLLAEICATRLAS